MTISKEFCIEMHRKMWTWIADKIEQENSFPGLYNLKKEFWAENQNDEILKTIPDPDMYKYCFCCLYAYAKNDTDAYQNAVEGCRACKDCLMCWNSKGTRHQCCEETAEYSFFDRLKKSSHVELKEIADQCRKVANLQLNPRS